MSEKTTEEIYERVVDDLVDTCLVDYGYLRSIVQEYVKRWDEAELRQTYRELFCEDPDETDEEDV